MSTRTKSAEAGGATRTDVTRLALMRAAERLFAERGVDVVSLREIAAAAGQRNHSSALYHFGDKRELIEAMLDRHSGPIASEFPDQLLQLRAEGREDLQSVVEVLVNPFVRKLDDEDGGVDYLTICAELVTSRTFPITGLRASNGPEIEALRGRLMVYMPAQSPALIPLRMLRMSSVLFGSLAAYHRLTKAGLYVPREEFRVDLVGSLVGLLSGGVRRAD